MTNLLQDLRHAARLMGRSRGFTLATLVTLALAIGANTAVFSVVYGVLLRPLPYPGTERIVRLSEEHPGGTAIVREPALSNLTLDAWRAGAQTVEAFSTYSSQAYTVMIGGEPARITGAAVAPSAFPMLGVMPALGRFFRDDEAKEGADGVVVLSDQLWRSRFGQDAAVVGRTIHINGRPNEIIGVTPAWFYFPDRDAQLWTPQVPPARVPGDTSVRVMFALARLKPGFTLEQAAAEGTSAARSVTRPIAAELLFGKGGPVEVRVRGLADQMTRSVRPAMLVLMTAVGLILLIACANVANLLLARGVSRGRELAVRAALGAGRGRLARQLLTESLAIGLVGGVLGVLVGWMLIRAVPAWAPDEFPRLDAIRLDVRVLGFALLASLAAGGMAGVVPAFRAARTGLTSALRTDDSRSIGRGRDRMRGILLALEAALSVALLIGAALLIRSFVALVNVDAGYNAANVLTGRVYLTGPVATPERREHVVTALVDRLRSSAGVVAAGAGNMAPLGESSFVSGFTFRAGDASEATVARALQYVVTPGYAEALGLRLREGRFFQPADSASGLQAMMVNDAFVKSYMMDGRPATGRRYRGLLGSDDTTTEIVGVVGNVLKNGLDQKPQAEIYLAHGRSRGITREINIVIRTSGDPSAFVPTLRSIVREVEPSAALGEVATLASRVSESVGQPRFATAVLAVFAALALALAATGLYGVLSYSVSQRKQEIGIRSALGATRASVIALVVRQGLTVTIVGLLLGIFASALATRLMQPLLFGITPLDIPSFVLMPLVLLAVAVVACALPARRAAATDPAETLRSE
jgi:putative ABC transport system permease protein